MAQEIFKQGVPASLSPEVLDSLANVLLAKLEGKILDSLLPKQAAAGSSPVSRSRCYSFRCSSLSSTHIQIV